MTSQLTNESVKTEGKVSRDQGEKDPRQDRSASCVILPVTPGLAESEVLYRRGARGRPELVIPLERPITLKVLQRLASRKDRAALIERALESEVVA